MFEDDVKAPEPSEKAPPEKAPEPSSDLKSARDWALETGNGPAKRSSVLSGTFVSGARGSVAYEVAKVLHGWNDHKHHSGSDLLLSKEDFLKALECAMPAAGNPVAHPPALSPHKGGGVKVTFKG